MTTVYLIRHALCDPVGRRIAGRAPGVSLNPQGIRQAQRLAGRLQPERLDAIYSSPLERALETAEPLAQRLGLPVQRVEALNEIDFGHWTGKTLQELDWNPLWRHWNARRSVARVPGGESMAEVQRRVVAALVAIAHKHPAGRCAAVSHGDVIRAALAHYRRIPLDDLLWIEVEPASVNVLRLEGGYAAWSNPFVDAPTSDA